MILFTCDGCGRTKKTNELWILGLAAEAVGVTAARREVTILPAWERASAVHPLAVHFCSEKCKDKYLVHLFGEEAPRREQISGRVVKTIPARAKTVKIRRKVRRRRQSVRAA